MTPSDVLETLLDNFELAQEFMDADGAATYQFDLEDGTILWCTFNAAETAVTLRTALPDVTPIDTVTLQKLLTASAQGRGVGFGSIGYDLFGNVALITQLPFETMTDARMMQAIAAHLSYVAHWSQQSFAKADPAEATPEEIIMVP